MWSGKLLREAAPFPARFPATLPGVFLSMGWRPMASLCGWRGALRKPGINLECGLPKKELNMKTCNREFMKTSLRNLHILPALIAGLGLILSGRAAAQTYTFGPEVQTTPSA